MKKTAWFKCLELLRVEEKLVSHLAPKLMKLKRQLLQIVLLGLAWLLIQTPVTAVPLVKNPLAPPDTSSPQATLRSFVENVNRAHQLLMESYDQYQQESRLFASSSVRQKFQQSRIIFERAQRCLNISEVPLRLKQDIAIESTLLLKEILDRIEVPNYSQIPDAEAVRANNNLSGWTLPKTEIKIVKIESGSRKGQFLFSPKTVERIEEFYHKVKNLPYKPGATKDVYQLYISTPGNLNPSILKIWFQNLPNWLNSNYWGQTLWQWFFLGISVWLAFWIPFQTIRWQLQKITTLRYPQRAWARLIVPFTAGLSWVGLRYFVDDWVNITGDLLIFLIIFTEIIFWIVLAIAVFLVSNALAETMIASPKINSKGINAGTLRIFFGLPGFLISILVLVLGLENVGIALAPIFAGLGISGVAIALAGQKTVENIFGGLTLFLDRPVRVGELCYFGDKEGYVEEIGIRSTRIRALNGDLISVPNNIFSELELVNKSRQKGILLRQIIGLRYETTSEQLRFVLVKLREMLQAHPKLLGEKARVRFVKYGDYSKDVEIFVYVDTEKMPDFLRIQEDVLLRVQDIVETAGTDFAFPSQTTYFSKDSGLDRERGKAAEAEVKSWREKGIFPFSKFPTEQQEELRSLIDFPPEDSQKE